MRLSPAPLALLALAACSRSGDDESRAAPALSVASQVAPAAPIASAAPVRSLPRAPAAVTPGLCKSLCERSRELKCTAAATCESRCAQMQGMPGCGQEMSDALACFAAQASRNWECDASGVAVIREGFCVEEQARVARCVQGLLGSRPE